MDPSSFVWFSVSVLVQRLLTRVYYCICASHRAQYSARSREVQRDGACYDVEVRRALCRMQKVLMGMHA